MSKFSVPPILGSYICKRQSADLEQLIRGEEGLYFQETLEALAALIAGMPQTGDTDGEGDDAVVYLHYFMGNFDFWITERDMGDGSADLQQHQAFGFVNLGDPDNAELGYISLPELFASNVELDLNWTPKTLAQVRASI
ncbi:MAG: hypothetical protein WCO17_08355 [Betaproteobacteria bacterium]